MTWLSLRPRCVLSPTSAGQCTDAPCQTSYIATPFFYVNQLFAKASLFVLYLRIFWSHRAFVRWVYVLATIHVCWFITFFFALLFLCTPVSKWWDVIGDQDGTCLDGNAFLVPEESINSAMDFAMIALTVYVVLKVMTRNHTKAKLTFIFVVGGLSGIIGFVKIGIVYGTADDYGRKWHTYRPTVACTNWGP